VDNDRFSRWLTLGANLAVLAGLVALVVEIRTNTAAVQAASVQETVSSSREYLLNIALDEDLSRIRQTGAMNLDELSESEAYRFNLQSRGNWLYMQNVWIQKELGVLDERAWVGSYVDVLNSVGEYSLARRFLLFSTGEAVQRNAQDEYQLGISALLLDDLNTASEHLERCLDVEPDRFFCRFYLVRVQVTLGDFDKAKSHLQYMKSRLGGENFFYLTANSIYTLVANRADKPITAESFENLIDEGDQFVPPFYKGTMFVSSCDIESALIEWEKSLKYGSFAIPTLRSHLTENWILAGKLSTCPPAEILARPDVQAFLAKMGIDEKGHRIIKQRALSLASVLEIEL